MLSCDLSGDSLIFQEVTCNALAEEVPRYTAQGYELLGRHHSLPIVLLRGPNSYVLLHDMAPGTQAAKGIHVDDLNAELANAWKDNTIDVFDGGQVGRLRLRLPAVRMPNAQIVYLISDERRHDFYADDFILEHAA